MMTRVGSLVRGGGMIGGAYGPPVAAEGDLTGNRGDDGLDRKDEAFVEVHA